MIKDFQQFWENTLSNAFGTIIAGIISAIFLYSIWNPFRIWVYKQNPKVAQLFQNLLLILTNIYLRLLIFLSSLIILYIDNSPWQFRTVSFIFCFVIFISFFNQRNKITKLDFPSTSFSDDFSNKDNRIDNNKWLIKTGSPKLFFEIGRPRLNLTLASPSEATNTFLIVKDRKVQRGIMECDIYLSPNSLFNFVFFCDEKKDNWHMARFESRLSQSDAFLIKDKGQGVNWRFNKILGIKTNSSQWHKIRLEFSSEIAKMYRNGELLGEITNPQMFGKSIGFFNECGEVKLGNFTLSEK